MGGKLLLHIDTHLILQAAIRGGGKAFWLEGKETWSKDKVVIHRMLQSQGWQGMLPTERVLTDSHVFAYYMSVNLYAIAVTRFTCRPPILIFRLVRSVRFLEYLEVHKYRGRSMHTYVFAEVDPSASVDSHAHAYDLQLLQM